MNAKHLKYAFQKKASLQKETVTSATINMATHLHGCLCTRFLHIAWVLLIKASKYSG